MFGGLAETIKTLLKGEQRMSCEIKEENQEQNESFLCFHWRNRKTASVVSYRGKVVFAYEVYSDGTKAGCCLVLQKNGKLADVYCRRITFDSAEALLLDAEVKIEYSVSEGSGQHWISLDDVKIVKQPEKKVNKENDESKLQKLGN